MKKKILFLISIISICLCLTGCQNKHDIIQIANKSDWGFDDISIYLKEGYFYENHEKFTVDDNTLGVTIYFSTLDDDGWDNKSE